MDGKRKIRITAILFAIYLSSSIFILLLYHLVCMLPDCSAIYRNYFSDFGNVVPLVIGIAAVIGLLLLRKWGYYLLILYFGFILAAQLLHVLLSIEWPLCCSPDFFFGLFLSFEGLLPAFLTGAIGLFFLGILYRNNKSFDENIPRNH